MTGNFFDDMIYKFNVPPNPIVDIKSTYKNEPVDKEKYENNPEIIAALPSPEEVMVEYRKLKNRNSDKKSVIHVSEKGITLELDID